MASIFSRGRGGGWDWLLHFPFYFCSEQSLWVTLCRVGRLREEKGRLSLRGRCCREPGPCLPWGSGEAWGCPAGRSLASLQHCPSCWPLPLHQTWDSPDLNCTQEEAWSVGHVEPRTFHRRCFCKPHTSWPETNAQSYCSPLDILDSLSAATTWYPPRTPDPAPL